MKCFRLFRKFSSVLFCVFLFISLVSVSSFGTSAASTLIQGYTREVGSGTKSPDNPYRIQGYTIGVNNDLTLYGNGIVNDTYDYETGTFTQYWVLRSFTGNEGWESFTTNINGHYRYVYSLSDSLMPPDSYTIANMYCTHYGVITSAEVWRGNQGASLDVANVDKLSIFDDDIGSKDLSSWRSWLSEQNAAGTPLTVLYRLSEPIVSHVELSSSGNPPTESVVKTTYLNIDSATSNASFSSDTGDVVPLVSMSQSEYSIFYNISTTHLTNELWLELDMPLYTFLPNVRYRMTMEFLIQPQYTTLSSAVASLIDTGLTSFSTSNASVITDGSYKKAIFVFDVYVSESKSINTLSVMFRVSSTGQFPVVLSRSVKLEELGYSSPDVDAMDDMDTLDGLSAQQNQQGMNNAANYQDSALTTIVKYAAGFQAIAAIIGKIGDIPFVGSLLTLSIAIGLFAFLLGMVGQVYRNSSNKSDAESDRRRGD